MFTARRELLAQCLPDVLPILPEHWEELARNREVVKLAPNWEVYTALENAGNFRAYVVRTTDGEVAGYAGFGIARHLHYREHVWATSDLFFVRKKFRRRFNFSDWLFAKQRPKGAGTVLFEAMEEDMKILGVTAIMATYKLVSSGTGRFLKAHGYTDIEMGAAKLLR